MQLPSAIAFCCCDVVIMLLLLLLASWASTTPLPFQQQAELNNLEVFIDQCALEMGMSAAFVDAHVNMAFWRGGSNDTTAGLGLCKIPKAFLCYSDFKFCDAVVTGIAMFNGTMASRRSADTQQQQEMASILVGLHARMEALKAAYRDTISQCVGLFLLFSTMLLFTFSVLVALCVR